MLTNERIDEIAGPADYWDRRVFARGIEAAATKPLLERIAALEAKLAQAPNAQQADPTEWNKLVSDREYLRLFDEARHGSTGGFGVLRGIRACIAAYEAATPAQQAEAQEPSKAVHQFRKAWCSDWYDGLPDHEDGGGPYETRTLFTRPQPASEPMTDEQTVRCIEAAGFKVWTSAHFRLVKEAERHHSIGVAK